MTGAAAGGPSPRRGASGLLRTLRGRARPEQGGATADPAADPGHESGSQAVAAPGWGLDPDLDRRLVLFESFEGNGALDSPRAIFGLLAREPAYAELRFAWSLQDEDLCDEVRAGLETELGGAADRLELVVRDSDRYRHLLGSAAYLVNNHGFPSYFACRPGQVYVNTWHGVPLKLMGFDVRGGNLVARSTLRNFLSADVLLSSGPAMTARLYHGAYRLAGLHAGRVLEVGTPRIDAQVALKERPEEARARLRDHGVEVDAGATVVLLAPTWKGRRFRAPDAVAEQLARRVHRLTDRLGPGYRVLVKVHQQSYRECHGHPGLRDHLVPNALPTNVVLAAVDVLVSDYSSILVDFLVTGRPVVLHRPDAIAYADYRGLYAEPDLPGPVTRTVTELAAVIASIGTGGPVDPRSTHAEAYARWVRAYAPHEDGGATRRVVAAVFGDDPGPNRATDPVKRRVLVYLGGLRPNGITSAALALLRQLDYDRFLVVAHFEYKKDQQDWARVAEIPPEVVQLIRTGPLVAPPDDKRALDAFLIDPDVPADVRRRAELTLDHEWRRCFGRTEFDHVVDYSGYSVLWAAKLARSPTGTLSIWQHNELAAEAANVAKRHGDGLLPLFDQYPHFDAVVSVSADLARINAEQLATDRTRARFTWARNPVDAERVRRLARGSTDPELSVAALLAAGGTAAVRAETTWRELAVQLESLRGSTTFVTVGRLTPEKNQRRLIDAFAALHEEFPDSRLLVVGDGELRDDLQQQIRTLDLEGAVTLLGHLANPYLVVAAADCFVLSSDYEGQPMTILEARVLGVPVLTTRFGSVDSVLGDGGGLVVAPDVDALTDGLRRAVHRTVPAPPFDVDTWNRHAVAEFAAAIGARARSR